MTKSFPRPLTDSGVAAKPLTLLGALDSTQVPAHREVMSRHWIDLVKERIIVARRRDGEYVARKLPPYEKPQVGDAATSGGAAKPPPASGVRVGPGATEGPAGAAVPGPPLQQAGPSAGDVTFSIGSGGVRITSMPPKKQPPATHGAAYSLKEGIRLLNRSNCFLATFARSRLGRSSG